MSSEVYSRALAAAKAALAAAGTPEEAAADAAFRDAFYDYYISEDR